MNRRDEDTLLPVHAARSGDPEAWNALFLRYQLPLYTFVSTRIPDEQTALDIVQDTFINAVRHIGTLQQNVRFGSWLFAIAHQHCARYFRKAHREDPVSDSFNFETANTVEFDPGQELERKEDHEAFLAALDTLPDRHRSILVLHYLDEFTLDEIRDILSIPAGTVKSRLHHARLLLRESLLKKPILPHEKATRSLA